MGGIYVCSGGWRPDSHVDQAVFHAGGGDQFGWLDFLLHGKRHGASSALAEADSDCLGLCPWCYGGGWGALLPGMLKIFPCRFGPPLEEVFNAVLNNETLRIEELGLDPLFF